MRRLNFIVLGLVFILLSGIVSAFDYTNAVLGVTFDNVDTSGTTSIDYFNKYNGTINTGTTTGKLGVFGQAYCFDGVTGYVNFGDKTDFEFGTGQFAISLHIYRNSTIGQAYGVPISKANYSSGWNGMYYQIQKSNGNSWFGYGTNNQFQSSYILSDVTYHHIVIQRNSSNVMSIWIDGIQRNSSTISTDLSGTDYDLLIATTTGNQNPFGGCIDDLIIFKGRSLSQSEIIFLNSSSFSSSTTNFELTLKNAYNQSSINNFTAQITNSTDSINITTTNGTIYYPFDMITNISIFNIDSNSYFNQTIINWNTSINLQVETYQGIIYTYAKELYTNKSLCTFNLTYGIQSNTSSNCFTTHYVNSNTLFYSGKEDGHYTNSTGYLTVAPLEIVNTTIYFFNRMFNLTSKDNYTLNTINNFNISIEGRSYTTTNGTINNIISNLNLTDITIFSNNYLTKIFSIITSNSSQTAYLQDLNSYFYFYDSLNSNYIINATISILNPLGTEITLITNSSGGINFSNNNVIGQYSLTFEEYNGYISPITFYVNITNETTPVRRTFNISRSNINIRIFNRETGNLLNESSDFIFFGYGNYTTTNGTINLNNLSIESGNYVMQVLSEGYGTEQKTTSFSNKENLTIDFYLLNLTGENTGSLYVSTIDEYYRILTNTQVSLMEYDTYTKAYIEVSECFTNSNGECTFNIELNKKTYILSAQKIVSGNLYSTITNPEIISSDGEVRQLFLIFSRQGNILSTDGLNYNATELYDWSLENKSQIVVYFDTLDGSSIEMCIEYYMQSTIINESCTIASSGILIGDLIDLDREHNYEANIYIYSNNGKIYLSTFKYTSINDAENILSEENFAKPIILFFWVGLLALSLFLKNMSLFAYGSLILTWVTFGIFPNILILAGSVLKTMIGLSLINIVRKKQDT